MITVHHSDMQAWLEAYDGPLFDSCVTDPPYHLTATGGGAGAVNKSNKGQSSSPYAATAGFMGQKWDGGDVAFRPETWRAVFDKLKPGAHLVAFSGSRTYHRMVSAIEDAGFEIRDQLCWLYGSGFPKSQDVSKFIDKRLGARGGFGEAKSAAHAEMLAKGVARRGVKHEGWDRPWMDDPEAIANAQRQYLPGSEQGQQYRGWGTALKPAHEPICLARKPLAEKSVAANVLKHGTGALNIDACRVASPGEAITNHGHGAESGAGTVYGVYSGIERHQKPGQALGRFPANLCHDGSDDVLGAFPDAPGQQGVVTGNEPSSPFANVYGDMPNRAGTAIPRGDTGSASRFFYSAKAGPLDRIGTAHATVKPVDLMRWLCRLVTPPGGLILEPFAGSGTTGIAAMAEGFDCTMIEMEAEHVADIERKLAYLRGEGAMSFREHDRRRDEPQAHAGPLFG